jgi:hypothetical protein
VVATVAACEKLAAGGEKKLVKVKWFNSNKEFGIITPGDGGDEESASNSDSDVPKKKRPAAKPAARLPSAKKGKGVAPAAKEKADVKTQEEGALSVNEKQLLAPVAEEAAVEADATPPIAENELAAPAEDEDFKGTAAGTASKAEEEEAVENAPGVQIRRVTKVVKGGKQMSFEAVVVIEDKKGVVGVGVGSAKEVITAV